MKIKRLVLVAALLGAVDARAYETAVGVLDDRLKLRLELAITRAERQLGLGFRERLEDDYGMLFLFSGREERLFWMKNMRIAIDILWIDRGRIVHIEHSVPPPGGALADSALPYYGYDALADSVLEVRAGFARRHGVEVGQTFRYRQE